MYAYVVYLRDGIKKVIPVRDIRGFYPITKFDFDDTHYKALWRGKYDEIPAETAHRHTVQVLRLEGEFVYVVYDHCTLTLARPGPFP